MSAQIHCLNSIGASHNPFALRRSYAGSSRQPASMSPAIGAAAGQSQRYWGKREFVQVLRLLEVFTAEDVAAGVRAAIERGAIGFDAVTHLVLCRIERQPPRLDMTVYPYLPRAEVAVTSARSYLDLLAGATP